MVKGLIKNKMQSVHFIFNRIFSPRFTDKSVTIFGIALERTPANFNIQATIWRSCLTIAHKVEI